MVILTITNKSLNVTTSETFEAPSKKLAIFSWMAHGKSVTSIRDKAQLQELLYEHDDISVGGPTWSTRFEFSFRE